MMKFIALILAFVLMLGPLSACGNEPQVIYGESEMYSERDMDRAVDEIMDSFGKMRGCVMYSLEYAGDEKSLSELDYCNSLEEGGEFDQCIVFKSTFRSPINGGGAWEENEMYYWTWTLARKDGGSWKLLTWGYA